MSVATTTTLIDAGGYRIRACARGEGEPLLLLNGLASSIEHWGTFPDRLRGFRTITLDLPGVGASPTPPYPLTVGQVTAIALGILDHYGVERAHVLGYSHGGAVAQQLAIDAPDRVERLVLVATHCGIGSVPPDPATLALYATAQWWRAIAAPLSAVGMLWQIAAIGSWSSLGNLERIAAPTLVVSGDADSLVPVANARILAGRIPGAALEVVAGAGHDVLRGAARDAVAAMIRSFLAAATSAAAAATSAAASAAAE